MGIKDFLQSRRDDAELGTGLWRRAHDRFVRGLDRFHQILERMPATDTLEHLIPVANDLADLLPRVRFVAAQAQNIAPSNGTDVPASPTGVYSDLHRSLSKASNSLALCAEALAMTRCAGTCEQSCDRETVVSRRVQTVVQHIETAEELLGRALAEKAELASA